MAAAGFILCIVFLVQVIPNQNIVFRESNNQKPDNSLGVLSINLLSSNTDFEGVNSLVKLLDPDILVLIEFTSFWEKHIEFERYPFQIQSIREDNFGIGLYSKLPLEVSEIIDFTKSRFPFIHGSVNLNETPVHILATHFENPVGPRASAVRKFQMEESARFLNQIKTPKLLIGDFNCTPYSYAFKSLVDQADLYDSRSKWTIGASWPTFFFPLMIPIDHALVSEEIQVVERRVLDSGGSDHRALFVGIVID